MKVFYTRYIPLTCVGHSCGHLQGGALQRIGASKFLNQCTDIKYYSLKIMHDLKYVLHLTEDGHISGRNM
jgi:hypothetical protein